MLSDALPAPASGQLVGRLVAVWRYPVKSMAGQPLSEAELCWHGLAGDRRWAFIRPGLAGNGFPWLTLRQRADLGGFRPQFLEPARPNSSRTLVQTPTGEQWDVLDPAFAAQLGDGVRVLKDNRGVFDTSTLSLISTQSIATLGKRVGVELAALRFRPNLLVESVTGSEFPEDAWVGRQLQIGGVWLRVDRRNKRCAIITIDPATGARRPEILRTVARERHNQLGVYAATVQPGRLAVGDPVWLLSR